MAADRVRAYLPLLLIGLCMEAVYALYLVPQFSLLARYASSYLDMGQITGHSRGGFVVFVVGFSVLFVLLGLAWMEVAGREDGGTLGVVLGAGAVFVLTMVFVYPVTAIDVYAYIDESLVLVHYHQNPIFVPPATYAAIDPLMRLSDGWSGSGAPYGPLGLIIDAIPALVVGRNLLWNLVLLKLLFGGLALAEGYLAYRIVRRVAPGMAVGGALLVAWNPLVLFEGTANAHNDIVMMFFVLLGLLSLVEGELMVGPVLILVSVLVKYGTVILLPLVLVYGLSRQPSWEKRVRYLVLTGVIMLVVAVIAYRPFWEGFDTLKPVLQQNNRYLYSFSSVLGYLSSGGSTLASWALVGRVLYLPLYCLALWLATRQPADLLRASFLAAFFFLALADTNFLFWYALMTVTLAAAVPVPLHRVACLFMAYGVELAAAFNIYLWVWIGVTPDNFRPINDLSYLMIFGIPGLMLLAAEARDSIPALSALRRGRLEPVSEAA